MAWKKYVSNVALGTLLTTGIGMFAFMLQKCDRVLKIADICSSESVTPQSYKIRTESIDQVFKDHNGYRVYLREPQTGKVLEDSYGFLLRPKPVLPATVRSQFKGLTPETEDQFNIYRDLKDHEHPFAKILEYTVPSCVGYDEEGDLEGKLRSFYYVEVHLPENQGLAAGLDYNQDSHNPRYPPMQEIR